MRQSLIIRGIGLRGCCQMSSLKPWQKKEKSDAKDFQGKVQKASGSTWTDPGDVKTARFLIDSKHTTKKSYSISLKTWDKLYEEALFEFRLPLLSLQIQNTELVVLDKADLLRLLAKEYTFTRESSSDLLQLQKSL